MAVAPQYSYRYRLRWDSPPRVVLAGEFGVGLDPVVALNENLILRAAPGPALAYSELTFSLGSLPLQAGDLIEVRSTPLNGHRSLGWWRHGELQAHLGDLQSLSGERVGGALLEIVNEFDIDECLAIFQRSWSQRLGARQNGTLGDYHFQLHELGGLVTGSSYRARGWWARTDYSATQVQEWKDSIRLP